MKKRSSYLQFHQEVDLDRAGITVSGYDKKQKFVCRLEINHSGIALHTGSTGRKRVVDVPWERLVEKLSKPKTKKRS